MRNSFLSCSTRARRKLSGLCAALACGWLALSQPAHAHNFHEGLVSIEWNPRTTHLEVVHSYTTHDLLALLMEQSQLALNFEHPEHEAVLRRYLEKQFQLTLDQQPLTGTWVGIRLLPQTVEIYQEFAVPASWQVLQIQNQVLQQPAVSQVNRVNLRLATCQASMVFDKKTPAKQSITPTCEHTSNQVSP